MKRASPEDPARSVPVTLTLVPFSLMALPGFAPAHRHAFVARGSATPGPLFRPGPVPRDAILANMDLHGATLHLAKQVHGARAVEYPLSAGDRTAGPGEPEEADALVTRTPGHAVGVATADCLPILLAAEDGACAAVHAGWRGLLAGVIEAALARLGDGARIEAAIGPAIGPCCFEVGPEVVARFHDRFPESEGFVRPGREGKGFVDLPEAASGVLRERGVPGARVRAAELCTRCGTDGRLESYRRDGKDAGRMIGIIGR